MKKILFAVMAVLILVSYAPARENARQPLKNPRAEIDQELCRLQKETMDLEARAWARRISNGEFTYGELNGNSLKWAGDPDCNRQLMQQVQKNLNTGNTAPLTEEEEARLEQTRKAKRAVLMPATRDKKLIDSLTADQCIALNGQYWSWRIGRVKDVTFKKLKQLSSGWPGSSDYNQAIIRKVQENIRKGQTEPLSTQQAYVYEACTEYDGSAYQEPKKK